MDPLNSEKGGQPRADYCPYCMARVEPDNPCPSCGLTAGSYKPQPKHLPAGTVLRERYLVGRVLGEGGFGITYIGRDLVLGMKVAIKEYFPTDKATRNCAVSVSVESFLGSQNDAFEKGKRRFLEEARTMGRLDRLPNIVGVRDFFEENATAYIVMEFIDGTTLTELTGQRGGVMPAWELLHLIEPLFDSLSAMHELGLIHRDISPDNLMLEHGIIKLLDFGCAREAADGAATMTIMLRHGYAPLEQYQTSSGAQGPWTDVYALAATIYFCVTGKRPPQSMDRIFQDELVPPRKLGADLSASQEAALLKALSVRPRERFQSAREFHTALYEGSVAVHFDNGFGEITDVFVARGDKLTPADMPKPEREGYSFLGWFLDEARKKPVRDVEVVGECTLYGGWEKKEVPVVVPFWRKRLFQIGAAALVGLAILGGVLGIVLGGGRDRPAPSEPVSGGQKEPHESQETDPRESGAARPPQEPEPTGSQPPETGPTDSEPSQQTDPPETQPSGTNPPGTNPSGTDPSGTDPSGTNPPETNPPETKPPETKPPETKPPETRPPETQPPETRPPVTQPPETTPPPADTSVRTVYGVEELLAALADKGVRSVIYCGDAIAYDGTLNITKPVQVTTDYVSVTSPVTVSAELRVDGELSNLGFIEVSGKNGVLLLNGKYSGDGMVRARQGGKVRCRGGHAYAFNALWLAGGSDLVMENGSSAGEIRSLVYDEEGSFSGAVHVNDLQGLRVEGANGVPIILDSDVTLDGGAVTVNGPLLISDGVTVAGEGHLELLSSFVNNGTVGGGVEVTVAPEAVLVNNGTCALGKVGFLSGSQIMNLGSFSVLEGDFDGLTVLNLGRLAVGPGKDTAGFYTMNCANTVIVNLRGSNRDINLVGETLPLLQDIRYDDGCTLYANGSLRMSNATIVLEGLLYANK